MNVGKIEKEVMAEKYVEKIRIFNHYTNYKGRLLVKTLCDLFNDVAEAQTEIYHVDVDTLNAAGMTWMLRRIHISLLKMPHKEEEVSIVTWPSGIDRLFALRDYQMFREDGEELVRATSEWMCIDLKRRRPVRLSQKVIDISTGHHIAKLYLEPILDENEQEKEMTGRQYFAATFDNIDFNGHVTQASYVRWITNSLPFDFLKDHILSEIEVVYAHEIMPDSKIHSFYHMEERGAEIVVSHRVKSEDGTRIHCLATTIWQRHQTGI